MTKGALQQLNAAKRALDRAEQALRKAQNYSCQEGSEFEWAVFDGLIPDVQHIQGKVTRFAQAASNDHRDAS